MKIASSEQIWREFENGKYRLTNYNIFPKEQDPENRFIPVNKDIFIDGSFLAELVKHNLFLYLESSFEYCKDNGTVVVNPVYTSSTCIVGVPNKYAIQLNPMITDPIELIDAIICKLEKKINP